MFRHPASAGCLFCKNGAKKPNEKVIVHTETIGAKKRPQRKEDSVMSLTRKMLKAMGIEEEKIDQIIEAHAESVDGLKTELNKYKADAEKLPTVQKELDDLKAAGDDGWKGKHDAVKKELDDYKAEIIAKETRTAKEKAVRAYYESKGIKGKNLDIAMLGSNKEIDGVELDGEKIKDAASLDSLVEGTFSGLVSSNPSFNWTAPVGGDKPSNTSSAMNAIIRGATK